MAPQFRSSALFALATVMIACGSSTTNTKPEEPTSGGSGGSGTGTGTTGTGGGVDMTPPGDPSKGPCWMMTPAFCDTFDTASPGGRAGDLDDSTWSAARISSPNVPQDQLVPQKPTTTEACGMQTKGVNPDSDMFFCAGGATPSMHFNDSYDDGAGFNIHSYRIRQPFDFTGRTGVISFDVGGKAQLPTGHGWWFNVFIASEPYPAPYQQGGNIALYAKEGVGVEFEAALAPCNNADATSNSVSKIYLEKDYAIVTAYSPPDDQRLCFTTKEEVLNHIEIHINKSSITVWATDAGDWSTFRKIAYAENLTIPLEKGYVSFQHTHYNANKANSACPDPNTNCPITHAYTTYHWDNIGFDGPKLPTPRAYEIPDTLLPWRDTGWTNIGYSLASSGMIADIANSPTSVTLDGVDLTGATDAVLTMNAWFFRPGDSIIYRFNGGAWRTWNHPFPTSEDAARGVVIPVALTDLKAGANTLEMKSATGNVVIANAELTVNTQ
jgi:hypothetical protein